MHRPLPALCLALALFTACSPAPQIGQPLSNTARAADYPAILPLDGLLAQQNAAPDIPTLTAPLSGRAAALRARAASLRATIVDAETRTRMQDALARH